MDWKNRNEYVDSLIHRNIRECNPQANIHHDIKENNGIYTHTYEGFDHFPASRVSHPLSRIHAEYGTKINPTTGQNQFYVEIPKYEEIKNRNKQFSFFQKIELFLEIISLVFYFIVFQKEWINLFRLSSI